MRYVNDAWEEDLKNMVIQVHGKESSSLPASSCILIVLRFLFSPMQISDPLRTELAIFEALTDLRRGIAGCGLCKDDDLRKVDCVLKCSEGAGAVLLSPEDL
jgi:hypothetical protein